MIGRVWRRARDWISVRFRRGPRPFALAYVDGDELPDVIPLRTLVVARDGDDLWSAGMVCPCGCGRRIEVMLLREVKPRWDLAIAGNGRPSLSPSVWAMDGCRSHFWLKEGEIHWSRD